MADYLNIAGRIRTTASDGVAMEAQEVKDLNLNKSQQEINTDVQTELGDRYTKEETYSKEQLDDLITTPDVNYVSVVATNATTAVTDILPATGEANTIYRVGNWNGTQYDPTMYALFAWNGTTYVCVAVRSFVGEVYDVSVNHPDGQGNPTPYADLTAALGTDGENIPADIRRGGMRIQFIKGNAQSSDNKYVQYMLDKNTWSSSVSDWEKVNNVSVLHNILKIGNDEVANLNKSKLFIDAPVGFTERISELYLTGLDINLRYAVKYCRWYDSKPQFLVYSSSDGSDWQQAARVETNVAESFKIVEVTERNSSGIAGYVIMTMNDTDTDNLEAEINKDTVSSALFSPTIYASIIRPLKEGEVETEKIKDNAVTTAKISDTNVTTAKIQPGAVNSDRVASSSIGADKLSFIDKGKNLFNPYDNDVLFGYYQSIKYTPVANESYNLSGYIPVEPNANYVFSYDGASKSYGIARFIALFGKDMELISTSSVPMNVNTYTVPNNVYFVRVTVRIADWDKFQMEKGSTVTSYAEYTAKINSNFLPRVSALGTDSRSITGQLLAGSTIELISYPAFLKLKQNVSLYAKITTMGTLYIGKGYQHRSGKYLKIDDTNISTITCNLNGDETESNVTQHGLTFSTFIKIAIMVGDDGNAIIELQTLAGEFTSYVSSVWANAAGNIFVKSVDFVGDDVKLSALHSNIKKPLWIIGDSFLSLDSPNRWPYYMIERWKINNYLIDAISGGRSYGSINNVRTDLDNALELATPKFILYCLGMNDGSDTDENTPSANWMDAVNSLVYICKKRNIEIIFGTIPCTASLNHEGKNKWIKNSGFRYVNFAKAVNGEEYTPNVLNWYDGYNNDGTHPTALGAQALATQVLVDFPEIIQF